MVFQGITRDFALVQVDLARYAFFLFHNPPEAEALLTQMKASDYMDFSLPSSCLAHVQSLQTIQQRISFINRKFESIPFVRRSLAGRKAL